MALLHPEVVHFAIALAFVGVAFRLVSFVRVPAFVSPAAATLLLLAALAVFAAVLTGDAAHGPIEQMPGLRGPVTAHEEWGNRTGYLFVPLAVVELAALAFWRSTYRRPLHIASAAIGVIALLFLYFTGERGGEIVYSYAGGVGTRTGDVADVERLYLAGLYQRALANRSAGHAERAATILEQASQEFPNEIDVQLAAAESQLVDRKNPAAAIDRLRRIMPPADNRFQRIRHGMLLADALDASGQRAAAIATLQQLQSAFPNTARVRDRLAAMQK
jgi:uncharacterized membrane protein